MQWLDKVVKYTDKVMSADGENRTVCQIYAQNNLEPFEFIYDLHVYWIVYV